MPVFSKIAVDTFLSPLFTALVAVLGLAFAQRLFAEKKSLATVLPGQPTKEGRVRRCHRHPHELLQRPAPEVKTLYDLLNHAAAKGVNRNCLGSRRVLRVIEEEKFVDKVVGGKKVSEKKVWKFFQLSDYEWLSYKDVHKITREIGSGLRQIGLGPKSRATIFAPTSKEWQLFAHGCWTINATITTAYDTLGEEGLTFSLNECEVSVIFTHVDLLPMIEKVAPSATSLKRVVYTGDAPAGQVEKLKKKGLEVFSLEDLRELGRQHEAAPTPPQPDDLACIMYTSGSTGNPKGVMLSHGNLVSASAGISDLAEMASVTVDDVYLAYLPLAHVLELVAEQTFLFSCVAIGYGSPRTLVDASVRECKGDLRTLRPTLMAGVPTVWETIRKGVVTKLNAQKPIAKKVFFAALAAKRFCLTNGLPCGIFDTLIFNKVKDQTGGRLRFALSGGAPIARDTQSFLSTVLCPVLQGYGLTETCGGGTIIPPGCWDLGIAGAPLGCTEIKLVDSGDYTSLDPEQERGEVWLRGPNVMQGYYKNEKATKEVLTDDGWFATGDIGEWRKDGSLAIIDRKKNLVKLAHGEYIALEKLESVYKSGHAVGNVCVYADSEKSFAVAVVSPAEPALRKFLNGSGIDEADRSFESLCEDQAVVDLVFKDLIAEAKKARLKGADLLGAIYLTHDEWTPQNGFLTAAQKLKRKEICDKYKTEINKLYS